MSSVPAIEGVVSNRERQIVNDSLGKLIQSAQNQDNFFSKSLKERLKDAEESLENTDKNYFTFGTENDPDSMLSGFVLSNLHDAHQYKTQLGVTEEHQEVWRMYNGKYSDAEKAQIAEQKSVEVWYPLAWRMVNTMVAFLRKTLAGGDIDHPQFDIEPTAIPEPPPELVARAQQIIADRVSIELRLGVPLTRDDVIELVEGLGEQLFDEARQRSVRAVERATREVTDKLQEGSWGEVFDEFLHTLCIYGTGIIEAPRQEVEKRQYFTRDTINTRKEYKIGFKNCDPFRFFFSRDSTTTQDGSYIIYVDSYSKKELMDKRGQEGYFSDAINTALAEFAVNDRGWCGGVTGMGQGYSGYMRTSDETEQETGQGHWGYAGKIDVVRYFGCVPGHLLINMGLKTFDGREVMSFETYEMIVEQIGDIVIYARCSTDPLCQRPFHSCHLVDRPGSPFGTGTVYPIKDLQRVANTVWRNTAVNIAFSAKPIAELDDALFASHGNDRDVQPGSVFVKNSLESGLSGQALHVHYMESRIAEFFNGLDSIVEHAELLLGLPRFLLGQSNNGGAARTLGGLNQLTSNAFVQIRSSILNIDNGVIKPTIEMVHRWIINRTDNQGLYGDVTVVTLGASALLAREVNGDRLQSLMGLFLPLFQAGMIKAEGITDLLKAIAENHGLDPDRLVVDPEQDRIDQLLLQQQLQQIGGFPGAAGAGAPGGTFAQPGGAGANLANPLAATGAATAGEQGVPQLPATSPLQGVGSLLDPQVQVEQRTVNSRRF